MPISSQTEDAALFRRAKTSEDAFAELYRMYSPAIYAWFRRHAVADPETAADLTAEVFARVIVELPRFRGSRPGSGTAWLFAIVRHLAVDYERHRQVEVKARKRLHLLDTSYQPEPAEDTAVRLDGERADSTVMQAFERLGSSQKAVVQMRVIDELSYSEIANRNGSTEQAARLHVMRGLRHLRQMVAPAKQEDT
jgi:RNA polymerase sigma factor (sigma-70 family)